MIYCTNAVKFQGIFQTACIICLEGRVWDFLERSRNSLTEILLWKPNQSSVLKISRPVLFRIWKGFALQCGRGMKHHKLGSPTRCWVSRRTRGLSVPVPLPCYWWEMMQKRMRASSLITHRKCWLEAWEALVPLCRKQLRKSRVSRGRGRNKAVQSEGGSPCSSPKMRVFNYSPGFHFFLFFSSGSLGVGSALQCCSLQEQGRP